MEYVNTINASGCKRNLTVAGAFTWNWAEFLIRTKIHKQFNLTMYDGVNNCKWNGGRINRDLNITQKEIEFYNRLGISVSFTFSNHIIDLEDTTGNTLLVWLDNSQKKYGVVNEITLVNEDLRLMLKNYNFRTKFSITGHDLTDISIEDLRIYYKDLESKYDLIVPKMEHVFLDVFQDVQKYELMLNDTCLPNCQYYFEHFQKINEVNTIFGDRPAYKDCNESVVIEECWLPKFDPNLPNTNSKYGIDFTPEMLRRASDLGFCNFKVSGRENKLEDIINDIELILKGK